LDHGKNWNGNEVTVLSELDNYSQRIEDLRRQVAELIADLPAEALNWHPTRTIEGHSTNSLAVLAAHIAGAERFWIAEVVGEQPPSRDRDAEFAIQATDASEILRLLEQTGAETQQVLSGLRQADLDDAREVRGQSVPVRWSILHVIDHTALHLGHMQITYQMWNEGLSKPSPFWFERLPSD
jgi:uncharacterized damage-inducible protein DinB